MNKKLWGGRFQAETHPAVDAYNPSIAVDQALVSEDILGSIAHANMLLKCHLLDKLEYEKLHLGLLEILADIGQDKVNFHPKDEDIHMTVERLLSEKIGEVAGKLHTARSRNDQVAVDVHLYVRKNITHIIEKITYLQAVLVKKVTEYHQVIFPGYTHLQRAQPIYFAKHLMAYVAMLTRDISRLQSCWERVNQCPLGAGALAGTTLKIDREYTAELLGFNGIYQNTLDAISDRDFVIEFLSAASLVMMHLSRLSEELILWSSQEFNFIEFDDSFCTGSSIMPQKKNPDIPELVRGKTGRVYGSLFTLLTVLKGLPLAYNKDLQEDKEPLFDTIKTLESTLTVYPLLLEHMTIHVDKMRQAARAGFSNATALADYLVKKGVAFRQAHDVVGKMVAYCLSQSVPQLDDLSLDEMKKFSWCIEKDVYFALGLDNLVDHQDRGNSENKSALEIEMDSYYQIMAEVTEWIEQKKTWS